MAYSAKTRRLLEQLHRAQAASAIAGDVVADLGELGDYEPKNVFDRICFYADLRALPGDLAIIEAMTAEQARQLHELRDRDNRLPVF